MKLFTTINRYIFKELFSPFVICLFFLTFVFLMTRIPEITNMVMNYNTNILSLFMLILYTIPRFLEFTIPISVMLAVLLTFMRMSGDNEIIALRSSGISIYKLLPPVLAFCLIGVILGLWVTVFAISSSRYAFKVKTLEMARTSLDLALQERQFNLNIEDIMIYVTQVDIKSKKMTDIFIEDRRSKGMTSISTAPSGQLISDAKRMMYTLQLYNGSINQVNLETGSVNTIHFNSYDINIDLGAMIKEPGLIDRDLDEKSIKELFAIVKDPKESVSKQTLNSALMEIHEKFAIPFACIFLGFLAFPIGIRSVSKKNATGFGMGSLFFLFYYLLLAAGWSASETGKYPPVICMWLPNLVMGAAGFYLLKKHAKR